MKKIITVFTLGLILTMQVNAQTPNLIWGKIYGNSGSFNQTLDCAPDNLGNIFVIGYTTLWPHGDYLVLKYNTSTGDVIWTKTFNGNPGDPANDNDIAMGCAVDGSGNLYVTGMSSNSAGSSNALTIKYNGSTGDTLWTRKFKGVVGTKCVLDANANLYIAGITSTGTFSDFCLLKYDTNGNSIWSHNYPSPLGNKGEAYECSINTTNVFISGYIYSGTAYKIYTVKCNTINGDTLWTRINNEDLDSLQYINSGCVANSSGDVYIAGNCSNAIKGVYGRIIKYDASGNVIWSESYENPINNALNDALYGCTLDLTGNLIVTGTTQGTSTFLNNFITLRYNAATGDTIWTKAYNGRGGMACAVDAQGYIYVTGTPQDWQGLILKYNNTGMVGIIQKNSSPGIKVYPNPANDIITLSVDNTGNSELTLNIYNGFGKKVRSELLKQNQRQISIRDLNSGIYVLEIKSGNWAEKQKLIIKR